MAENENMVVNEIPPETSNDGNKNSIGKKIWGGIKEWIRKQVVTLKRSPQRIPLFIIVICSVLWLLWLFTFSQAAYELPGLDTLGLIIFINTMLSILILPLFLNAFPKRKKPNIIFIALVFIFIAALIAIDLIYYMQVNTYLFIDHNQSDSWIAERPYMSSSLNLSIAHIILVAISALSLALMPVYAPLIKKINTAKEIEGNDIHETIDVEDDE